MNSLNIVIISVVLYFYQQTEAATSQSSVAIPSWCYSPPGNDCTWYKECINKRYACSDDNYVMKYAHYFCKKFGEDYHLYSAKGKQWVDRTRKCLQRVLVPYLDNFTTCSNLKKQAFASHTCCYLAGKECTPTSESHLPSICQIPLTDWFRVFWTIKDAFNVFSGHADVISTMQGGLGVMKGCTTSILGDELAKKQKN